MTERSAPLGLVLCLTMGAGLLGALAAGAGANHVSPVGVSFSAYNDPPTVADGPTRVVAGDFNNDGKPDLAANATAASLSLLYGDGLGGFPQPAGSVGLPDPAVALVVADLNGDGFDDVATFGGSGGANTVAIRLGSAGGLTGSGSTVAVANGNPTGLAAGRLDGDADLDLVATTLFSTTQNKAVPLLNNGSGSFAAGTAVNPACETSGDPPLDVALADANDDTKVDAVLSCATEMDVLLGDGAGGLGAADGTDYPGALVSNQLAVTDFEGDGDPDVVAAGFTGSSSPGHLLLMINDGGGGFSSVAGNAFVTDASGGSDVVLADIQAGDVNGDGHPDVVATNSDLTTTTPSELVVALGDGLSSFTPVDTAPNPDRYGLSFDLNAAAYGNSLGAGGLALSDLDGDGRLDATATADDNTSGNHRVVPLLNSSSPSARTGPATAITQTQAQLEGTVRPGGMITNYQFEYGTTTGYGSMTPLNNVPAGGAQSVSALVTGLAPDTAYHYRLRADNALGAWVDADRTLTTLPNPPQPAPGTSGRPSILGKAKLRRLVSCSPGSWTGNPSFSFRWLRNGNPIAGEIRRRHRIRRKDIGKALQCAVTATNPGGSTTAESKPRVPTGRRR